jgi:hypothetical protein
MKPSIVCLLFLAGCANIDAGGVAAPDALAEDDPLAITDDELDPESFDAIQRDIIAPSCATTEGFCHYGQFEPNLSTPALAYEALVNRPGIELFDRYRVTPGDPAKSLVIDKLRKQAGVATQMPLGAPPMAEEDIQRLEKWIADGALRRPGADPAPQLNEPPMPPELAVFDAMGNRLDGAGPVTVQVGQTIVLRHSVKDFETPDALIPYGGLILQTADARNALVEGADEFGTLYTVYDPMGPEGTGDLLDWQASWTIPAEITLSDGVSSETVPADGQQLFLIGIYLDDLPAEGGILTFAFQNDPITIGGGS